MVYVRLTPTAETQPAVIKSIVNDRGGNVKEYFYASRNRIVMQRSYTGRAIPSRPTTETVNRPTRQLRRTDPKWFETRYEWNVDSQLTRLTQPNGNVTERVYELALTPAASRLSRGNLRLLRRLAGRTGGDQTEIVQSFEYDTKLGGCCGANFVTKATDARGHVTRNTYDTRGNLLRVQDRRPDAVEDFEYNEFGQLTQHTLPDNGGDWRRVDRYAYFTKSDGPQYGYLKEEIIDAKKTALTTRFECDAVGNNTRIRDPRGNDVVYVYNRQNQVVREVSRPVTVGGPRYQTDTFYDANDNTVRVDRQNGGDAGVTRENSYFTTTHGYEILNRRTRTRKQVAPGRFVETENVYDANRNVVLRKSGEATNKRQPNNAVALMYDERDLPLEKVVAPGDREQSTRRYDYDLNGNRVRQLVGLEDKPREVLYIYDGFDRLKGMSDPMGNRHEHTYDANGNVTRRLISGELEDLDGGRLNLRLLEESSTYDEQDRLTRTERLHFDRRTQAAIGDGRATLRVEHNANSQITRIIDDNGAETRMFYDTANREWKVVEANGDVKLKSYDANSNLTAVEEEEATGDDKRLRRFRTKYEYDGLDRVSRSFDGRGESNSYTYDSRDNVTSVIDALGNVTRLEYDDLGRLLRTRRFLGKPGAAQNSVNTSQEWDDNSRLVLRRDGNGNVTRYTYDALNRETSVTYADRTANTYTYDVHGNQTTMRDANGTRVASIYDLLDRVTRRAIAPGPGVSRDTTFEEFGYDGLSRLVRARDDDSLVVRDYDSLSFQTRETLNGQLISCTRDAVGNKRSCTYPGGRAVRYDYDRLNRMAKVADQDGAIATFDYAGGRRLSRRRYSTPEATLTSVYSYDGDDRMTASSHYAGGDKDALIDARRYAWDAMGNKTQQADLRAGDRGPTHNYGYDSLNRLIRTSVTDASGAKVSGAAYEFDESGNRLKVSGDKCSGAYTLDASNPAPADRQVNQYTATGCDTRSYDNSGNLMRVVSGGTRRVMAYDYRNRMTVQTREDGSGRLQVGISYDALGRRIAKTIGAPRPRTTRFFYDDWQVVEEQDEKGTTEATYVYGQHPNDVLTMRRGKNNFYYHGNDLRSVTALTNEKGRVVERYDYQDFGQPVFYNAAGETIAGSSVGNPYLFTGQPYDPETGLYYYRTRYLDPVAGRFTTRDSIGIWATPPTSATASPMPPTTRPRWSIPKANQSSGRSHATAPGRGRASSWSSMKGAVRPAVRGWTCPCAGASAPPVRQGGIL